MCSVHFWWLLWVTRSRLSFAMMVVCTDSSVPESGSERSQATFGYAIDKCTQMKAPADTGHAKEAEKEQESARRAERRRKKETRIDYR